MIRFSLSCGRGHGFEGWFAGNADYDRQKQAGLILCPVCGSAKVEKSLMAPHIAAAKPESAAGAATAGALGAGALAAGAGERALPAGREVALQKLLLLQKMQKRKLEVLHKLQKLARKMRENAENVGSRFTEEARKIHFGEADKRPIYGRAALDDVRALREEGIDVLPLPRLPEDNH